MRRAALASRLRQARAAAQLTQEQVASRAGMDRGFYGQVERGLRGLSVDKLWLIADALGRPITDLLREDC
jgi:transcriptional regulator with XRE-family HTH domain